MGSTWMEDSGQALRGSALIKAPEAKEVVSENTLSGPSGETVRLYVSFKEGTNESLSAETDYLISSLPGNAVVRINRLDETGYAAVVETTDTMIGPIEKLDNVLSVKIEEAVELTGQGTGESKKKDEETETVSDTETTLEAVPETETNETYASEISQGYDVNEGYASVEAITTMEKGFTSPVLIGISVGVVAVLLLVVLCIFIRKKKD